MKNLTEKQALDDLINKKIGFYRKIVFSWAWGSSSGETPSICGQTEAEIEDIVNDVFKILSHTIFVGKFRGTYSDRSIIAFLNTVYLRKRAQLFKKLKVERELFCDTFATGDGEELTKDEILDSHYEQATSSYKEAQRDSAFIPGESAEYLAPLKEHAKEILGYVIEGYSYAEIAKKTHSTENQIRSRLHAYKTNLRKDYASHRRYVSRRPDLAGLYYTEAMRQKRGTSSPRVTTDTFVTKRLSLPGTEAVCVKCKQWAADGEEINGLFYCCECFYKINEQRKKLGLPLEREKS